jgi:hypothetical protein
MEFYFSSKHFCLQIFILKTKLRIVVTNIFQRNFIFLQSISAYKFVTPARFARGALRVPIVP